MLTNNWLKLLILLPTTVGLLALVYGFILLPWHTRWGATEAEASMTLPGDEIVPEPKTKATRAITIQAPAAEVWSWLVQIGHGRGGMYSYDWLENLVGCDLHSAERIHPEWQDLQVGDPVHKGPEGYPYYTVQTIESGRILTLQSNNPQTGELAPSSWAFVLHGNQDGNATRLITRQLVGYEPSLANFLIWRVATEPISFVMEQRMLRTLRDRAEGA